MGCTMLLYSKSHSTKGLYELFLKGSYNERRVIDALNVFLETMHIPPKEPKAPGELQMLEMDQIEEMKAAHVEKTQASQRLVKATMTRHKWMGKTNGVNDEFKNNYLRTVLRLTGEKKRLWPEDRACKAKRIFKSLSYTRTNLVRILACDNQGSCIRYLNGFDYETTLNGLWSYFMDCEFSSART